VKIETDVEHTDLDTDDDDAPMTMVYVAVCMPDGMRYTGTVACVGTPGEPELAEMIRQAAEGAGATHSPRLGRLVAARHAGGRA
jgi:hypothetical protein